MMPPEVDYWTTTPEGYERVYPAELKSRAFPENELMMPKLDGCDLLALVHQHPELVNLAVAGRIPVYRKLPPPKPIEVEIEAITDAGHVYGAQFKRANGDRHSHIPEEWIGMKFRQVIDEVTE